MKTQITASQKRIDIFYENNSLHSLPFQEKAADYYWFVISITDIIFQNDSSILIPDCSPKNFWFARKKLKLVGCHCSHIVQRCQINSNKVFKTKRFHETNYTERQNIVNNKSINNWMIWFHKIYNCPRMWRRMQRITKLRAIS